MSLDENRLNMTVPVTTIGTGPNAQQVFARHTVQKTASGTCATERSRLQRNGPEEDFRGVRGCTSTSRAFPVNLTTLPNFRLARYTGKRSYNLATFGRRYARSHWIKAGTLRDPIASRDRRNGRSLSRARHQAGAKCCHQGAAGAFIR